LGRCSHEDEDEQEGQNEDTGEEVVTP